MENQHEKSKRPAARFNYRFTYNNYTEDGEYELKSWLKNFCKYACYGHEIAPTTGTPHLQGYFSLIKKQRINGLQKKLQLKKISLAILKADASAEENKAYCMKEDPHNFWEYGNISLCGAGARTDLTEVTCRIKDGTDIETIAYDYSEEYVKYARGLRDLHSITKKRRIAEERDITVSVFYGASGTGKTKRAIEECKKMGFGYPFICIHPNADTLWFNNYNGEKGLVIDDFYGWIKPAELYRFLDKNICQIPYKGGYMYAEWTHVWITSNCESTKWYSERVKARLDERALARRLHNIERYEIDMLDELNIAAIARGEPYIKPDIFIEKSGKPLIYPLSLMSEELDDVDPDMVVLPQIRIPDMNVLPEDMSQGSIEPAIDLDVSEDLVELAPYTPSPIISFSSDEESLNK